MISIGNHDYDYEGDSSKDPSRPGDGKGSHPPWMTHSEDSGGECGVPALYRFHMPESGNSLWWYSYDYGMVHFTVFSTEHNFTVGSPMYRWLERDLKSLDRKLTPWVIVVGHRPMYFIEQYPDDYNVMQRAFEDIFYEHKVNLAVWGHMHSYERTCPIHKQRCSLNGIVHVVVGSAGFDLDAGGYNKYPWCLHYERSFGYLRVTAANGSALHLEYVHNVDSTVGDELWIQQS